VENVDAAMIREPTGEDDTCVYSSPGGSLIEINDCETTHSIN
jgi:hypothetical protein